MKRKALRTPKVLKRRKSVQLKYSVKVIMLLSALVVVSLLELAGCSSAPPVKSQAYAQLKNERTFEFEFPVVWKSIEETFRNYKVTDRDPDEVGPIEMRTLKERNLTTDWVYGQSRDKYQEYQVNGTPRKKYLQVRVKYEISAKTILGGVHVVVAPTEEVEKLNEDGSSNGFSGVSHPDPSRASEILDKIGANVLAAPPT